MSSQIKYARANDVDMMTFDCEEELYKMIATVTVSLIRSSGVNWKMWRN
jgi:hypothetical protein